MDTWAALARHLTTFSNLQQYLMGCNSECRSSNQFQIVKEGMWKTLTLFQISGPLEGIGNGQEILIQNAIIGRNVDLPNQVHSSVASRVDQPDAHVAQSIVPPVAPHTNPLALPTSLPPIAPTNTPIDVPTIPFSKAPRTAPVVGQVTRASPRAKARNNKTHECIPCKLKNSEGKFVAKGFFKNEDPTLIIGGKKLGEGWCVVTINGGISREAKLPRPTGKMQVIADALGSNVAWPRAYVKLLNGK
ncbi:uncharacterized protein LOC143892524 [Tasmannia lanceolata]|uniref:uncharacterized protein LOC143892524 n=1 Tax=Tasmannia lanceolata TaxID=3420 RepID=UPI0040645BEF